ncbi:entericidin B [Mesorhizobium sp. J18]|uniref:entericidin domain-containing protein n=1 Tax=Mesorhizobium sp. J18 TaxID=935263 RepID=UPI00119A52E3|nr:entericidin [Mesorhizobium sp. J18]TWG93854.1 entericidin B [Mesorhizobium sp. J18]
MIASTFSRIAVLLLVAGFAAGCANTIRGMGRDTANAVNATQAAGQDIEQSTY